MISWPSASTQNKNIHFDVQWPYAPYQSDESLHYQFIGTENLKIVLIIIHVSSHALKSSARVALIFHSLTYFFIHGLILL